MRAIGVDYGGKRTGIAVVDDQTGIALPFEMFENLPDAQLAEAIAQLCRREDIDTLIVGLPLNADGSVSPQAIKTERFIVTLEQATGLRAIRMSEYLSTFDVESKLAGHFTRKQKRQRVDALAAARILQDYVDQQKQSRREF